MLFILVETKLCVLNIRMLLFLNSNWVCKNSAKTCDQVESLFQICACKHWEAHMITNLWTLVQRLS